MTHAVVTDASLLEIVTYLRSVFWVENISGSKLEIFNELCISWSLLRMFIKSYLSQCSPGLPG